MKKRRNRRSSRRPKKQQQRTPRTVFCPRCVCKFCICRSDFSGHFVPTLEEIEEWHGEEVH